MMPECTPCISNSERVSKRYCVHYADIPHDKNFCKHQSLRKGHQRCSGGRFGA